MFRSTGLLSRTKAEDNDRSTGTIEGGEKTVELTS